MPLGGRWRARFDPAAKSQIQVRGGGAKVPSMAVLPVLGRRDRPVFRSKKQAFALLFPARVKARLRYSYEINHHAVFLWEQILVDMFLF